MTVLALMAVAMLIAGALLASLRKVQPAPIRIRTDDARRLPRRPRR